jgi:hypothetical protein
MELRLSACPWGTLWQGIGCFDLYRVLLVSVVVVAPERGWLRLEAVVYEERHVGHCDEIDRRISHVPARAAQSMLARVPPAWPDRVYGRAMARKIWFGTLQRVV